MGALRAEGHELGSLLECAGLARSSYYYALSHPTRPPRRPELWEAAAEIFSRTANGCGHRQIAMCLRAERGVRIAYKTVLKMMREMGISCGIRRETDYHRYNSYRGKVGKTFENVIGRDFAADGPWEKMGTDVTEFRQPWGKAYFAPVYDFGSREIVAWSTSLHPNMAQQHELLDQLRVQEAQGLQADPALGHGLAVPAGRHGAGGWRRPAWCRACPGRATASTTARRSRCSATSRTSSSAEGRGRTSSPSRRTSTTYVVHWNTRRRQVKLKGLTPEEFRSQSLAA